MPRWEPGTRDRLERAALELYASRGYREVTVQDIAAAAGTTKATYFRTFADKREVLFWGQDLLRDLFRRGVAEAPARASVVDLLGAALDAVGTAFPPDRHALAATREAIVDGHDELRERRAAKRAALRDAIEESLRARGVDEDVAVLAADLGREAFSAAYRTWAATDPPGDLAALARARLDALVAAAGRL